MNKPRYHVHGLEGFRAETYRYVGNYRWFWLARFVAGSFVGKNPYGQAVVTHSKRKPKIG